MSSKAIIASAIAILSCGSLAGCATSETAASAPTIAPACASPQSRQLDFFVGDWDIAWSMSDGRSGSARNTVVVENGGCVIREHFIDNDGVIEGTGIYSYFAPASRWTMAWMDSQGTTSLAFGGAPEGGPAAFVMNPQRGADPNKQYRMVFEDVTQNTFVWRYQSRSSETEAWLDLTVSQYTRRQAHSALQVILATGIARNARNARDRVRD
jgi:hypothetical protein